MSVTLKTRHLPPERLSYHTRHRPAKKAPTNCELSLLTPLKINFLGYPRVNLTPKLLSRLDEQQAALLLEPNSHPGRYNPFLVES